MYCRKTTLIGSISLLFIFTCVNTALMSAHNLELNSNFAEIQTANNEFAFNVLRTLVNENEKTNILYSPLCITQVLAMLLLGARGSTNKQLISTLKYKQIDEKDQIVIHRLLSNFVKSLKSSNHSALYIANAIFPQMGFDLNDKFIENVKDYYNALIKPLDFKNPEIAIKVINDYIFDETNKKIDKILPAGSLNELTRLVLTNAIYFKGFWEDQFDPDDTMELLFTPDAGKEALKVKMMTGKKQAFYGAQSLTEIGVELQVLQLNYKENDLAMLILLPQQNTLDKLIQNLTPDLINNLRSEGRRQSVNIAIPKFKVDFNIELKKVLQKLGLVDIFNKDADFSGMVESSGNPSLYVDEIYHKTFIDVNEAGSEAAAAAAAVLNLRSFPVNIRFQADKPFLYFILNKPSGVILFAGTYNHPN